MKRLALIAATILFPILVKAQYIPVDQRDTLSMDDVEAEISTVPVIAVDTLDTGDKYLKVVLFENHTWEYIELGRPVIDTAGFYEGWTNETLHAFKGHNVNNLPEEIELKLVDSLNPFSAPIVGNVRSGFKFRRTREHKGIDVPLHIGDTVRAAFNGIVRYIGGVRQTGGYGNLVIIRHPNGLETYYGHLSKILVGENESVKAGEIIGLGGSTGRSTGPHLHFETRYMGHAFDPQRVVNFEEGTVRDSVIVLKRHYFSIYSHYGQTDEESKAASDRIVYSVRKGDTLGSIAKKYGTTVAKICKLNNIKSTKTLRIGEKLIVR
ncbi:MAG: peptidoglycan DD-metalloendopeptidase family protein [Bacteroidales bacterium]|nr:peptidoglycan DD-metalloendopeptidase family protein [Candidatus Cacconaster equifaecalis]